MLRRITLRSLSLNKYGWTALSTACYFGQLDIVKYLTNEHRCDPNATNSNGWHSLIFTIMGSTIYSHYDHLSALNIVEYLLSLPNIDAS